MRKCIFYGLALVATLCYSSYEQNEKISSTQNTKMEKVRYKPVANTISKTSRA